MARKITIAQKNLQVKLLDHTARTANAAKDLVTLGVLSPQWCEMLENCALDLIGALREYQRSTKVLFAQGQKS